MTKPKKLRKAKRPSYIELNRFILFTLKPTEGKIFLFSLIALAGGIVSLILRFNTASWILIFLGFIGIIAGLIRLCRNLFSMPKSLLEKDSKILDKISSILPSIHEEKFAYKTFEVPYRREQVVRSSEVDRLLQSTKIRLLENSGALHKILSELQASANQMEQILRCQFRKCLRSDPPKQFTNESKLCMASDIFSDLTEIKIYRGSYFISFLTNEICTRKLVTLTEFPTTIFSGSEMFPLTHDSDGNIRLKPISQSLMGNHIGISTIGHSVDGKLCLWRQSKKALQSVDLLAPTGSGSCDWTDIPSSNLLEDLVISAMEREFHEESNRRGSRVTENQIRNTNLLGYFRWISRGGKPEFVGVSKLNVAASDLNPNIDEVDAPRDILLSYPADTYLELCSSVTALLEQNDLSVPLWVNLIVLKEALVEDQKKWENFFF